MKYPMYILLVVYLFAGIAALHAQQVNATHIVLSGKQLNGDLNSSKLNEYTTLPSGVFADSLYLSASNVDFNKTLSLHGLRTGHDDQQLSLQTRVHGLLNTQVTWSQLQHNYSNSGKTLFSGSGSGMLEIPKDIRRTFRTILATDTNPNIPGTQFDTTTLASAINGMARGISVVSLRDKITALSRYTPSEEIEIILNYSNERRSGIKPLGGVFYFQIPAELPEPTSYRTEEISGSIEYATTSWNARVGYSASRFENAFDVLVWDNPFREQDFVGAASHARMDLYPSSSAHTVSFSGSSLFPLATRFALSTSYSERAQNDNFIPYTINAAVETLQTLPPLPAQQLQGKVGVSAITISLTNRFFPEIWFSAKYRYLNYNNQTPKLKFLGYVDVDNIFTRTQRQNLLIDYKKTNIQTDATIRLISGTAIKLGYEQEDWLRRYGETRNTRERIYKASFDYSALYRLLLKTSFAFSVKDVPDYDWNVAVQDMYPNGLPVTITGQLPQLRKFDLANRERSRGNLFAQYMPSEIITVGCSMGMLNDIFPESEYGLSKSKSNNASLTVSFNPTYDIAFSTSYTREHYDYAMKSRQRTTRNDDAINDWSGDMSDNIHTFTFSSSWSFIPEEWSASADISFSDAQGVVATMPLGDQTNTNYIVTTAEDYPDTRSILRQCTLALSYHFAQHLTSRIAYRFEGYSESDFSSDVMDPYMIAYDKSTPQAVYLGIRQPSYFAHIISLDLVYDF